MSPTSYQAAPPRESILAERLRGVKVYSGLQVQPTPAGRKSTRPARSDETRGWELLPGVVGRAFIGRGGVGIRVHVGKAGSGLIGTEESVLEIQSPVFHVGYGVGRDLA
jgi:hypothetical protein